MLTRAQKEERVAELKEKFARATSVIVADYRGLSVPAVNELRNQLRNADEANAYEYRVTKNTLLRRAVEGSDLAEIVEHFEGPTAIAISYGDPAGLAKILSDFGKKHEVFEMKAGVIEGRSVGPEEIATLATLPNLDGLRSQILSLLQAPATKIVRVLAAPGTQLARVVDARRGQLEESGGAS